MFNKISWYLAYRYLNSQERSNFVSFITIISIIGVALGTAILIIVLSVLNGFRDHIENKLLQDSPHIIVENISDSDGKNLANIISKISQSADKLDSNIKSYALIKENGLIKTNESITPVNIVSQYRYLPGDNSDIKSKNTVEISRKLAEKLNLYINDKIIIAAPVLKNSIIGPQPRFKRFIVKKIIDIDPNLLFYKGADILMPYASAINFFDLPDNYISGLYIYIDRPLVAQQLKKHIVTNNVFNVLNTDNINNLKISTWYDFNKTLFQAIKLERVAIILLLLIIITVAAFNLISGLYIQVAEKQKDVAILKTYGLSRYKASSIFVIQGLIIGVSGCFTGSFFGLLISFNLDFIFHWLQSVELINTNNVFFNAIATNDILISPDISDVVTIISCALIICIIATILPAYRASKILPIENLKHE